MPFWVGKYPSQGDKLTANGGARDFYRAARLVRATVLLAAVPTRANI
jgi:hypothetical protein